jgi:hypothetical protein
MRRKSMLKDYRRNKKTLSEQHLLDLYDDKKRVYDVKKKPPHQRTSDDQRFLSSREQCPFDCGDCAQCNPDSAYAESHYLGNRRGRPGRSEEDLQALVEDLRLMPDDLKYDLDLSNLDLEECPFFNCGHCSICQEE